MPIKSTLTNQTIGSVKTLVQSTKTKLRKSASPDLILSCPVLPCPAFVLFCPVKHCAETLMQSAKISEGLKSRKAASPDLIGQKAVLKLWCNLPKQSQGKQRLLTSSCPALPCLCPVPSCQAQCWNSGAIYQNIRGTKVKKISLSWPHPALPCLLFVQFFLSNTGQIHKRLARLGLSTLWF